MSCFEFEFSCRILKSILEFDFSNSRSRILKSNFKFVFFVSSLYSTSRISIRICRRNFRCLALFDFSNFDSNLSSNSTSRISLLYSTSRSRSSNSISRSSTSRFKSLEFDDSKLSSNFEFVFFIVLIYSASRTSIRICRRNCRSRSRILHLSS